MITNKEELKAAVAKVIEGRMTIWNARLELAISANDPAKVEAVLARLPGDAADGGQGCGCGCGSSPQSVRS